MRILSILAIQNRLNVRFSNLSALQKDPNLGLSFLDWGLGPFSVTQYF